MSNPTETLHDTVFLFDMDGTLSPSRGIIPADLKETLKKLCTKYSLGVVSGSDLTKIEEQLGKDVFSYFTYVFSENGLVYYKNEKLVETHNIKDYIGQAKYNKFVNFIMKEIAEIDIPVKTGTFIELRTGTLNVSPIGRNCTQQEREEFVKIDTEKKVRENLIKRINAEFSDLNLVCAIGGQVSFDIYPVGWDKTFCLRYVKDVHKRIEFFGDRTFKGGNDYEIAHSAEVHEAHQVKDPQDLLNYLTKLI